MSEARMERCKVCGEMIPPHSRVCPYCLVNDSFRSDIREFDTPFEMLSIMRSVLDEYLEIETPIIVESNKLQIKELMATFECVRDVVMLSFGRVESVVEAVDTMEQLLYEREDYRKAALRKSRIIAALIGVTILIFALFVLIY